MSTFSASPTKEYQQLDPLNQPTNNDDQNELKILVILFVFALSFIVVACIILKRYYNYKILILPPSDAPLAAGSHYDRKENSYKPLTSKLNKSNIQDINNRIVFNKKGPAVWHMPHLTEDPISSNQVDNFNEYSESGNASEKSSFYSVNTTHERKEDHTTIPVTRRKNFDEIRYRFAKRMKNFKPKKHLVMTVEDPDQKNKPTKKPKSSTFIRTTENFDSTDDDPNDNNLSSDSENQKIAQNIKNSEKHYYQLNQNTKYRMQAMEYAQKIENLIMSIDDEDYRLRKKLDESFESYFNRVKQLEVRSGFDGSNGLQNRPNIVKYRYKEDLAKIPLKDISKISNHINSIRYGPEMYNLAKLEYTKSLIDVFCNKVIELTGVTRINQFYKLGAEELHLQISEQFSISR